jgi:replicative DNA helicase
MDADFTIYSPVSTGIPLLDNTLSGGLSSGVHSFEADTGGGKTAMLLQIASNAQYPTIFLNCDMLQQGIYQRLMVTSTGMTTRDIQNVPPGDELTRLKSLTTSKNSHLTLENGKAGFVSVGYLREKIDSINSSVRPDTVLLIIDSINSWIDTALVADRSQLRVSVLSKLSTELLDLVQHNKVTLICSAQKSNEAYNREVNELLETISDTYINISYERGGRVDSDGNKDCKFFIKKNRSGVSGRSVLTKFDGSHQKYF